MESLCPTCGTTLAGEVCLQCAGPCAPGDIIEARYRIEQLIGAGGMGVIYRATHLALQRPFAIKVLHKQLSNDPLFVARFEREARALAALSHPNCVAVTDFGKAQNGDLFLVMEFVEGRPLDAWLDQPVALDRALLITAQVLRGLQHAHDVGVVHRDVKPQNVIVTEPSEGELLAKLLDFGIARVEQGEQREITQTGTVVGTPAYMAPEQVMSQDADHRVDIYATGAMLWRMLVGEHAFGAHQDPLNLLRDKLTKETPKLRSALPTFADHPLEALLAKAMARDPKQRYDSATRFLAELERVSRAEEAPSIAVETAPTLYAGSEVKPQLTKPQRSAWPDKTWSALRRGCAWIIGYSGTVTRTTLASFRRWYREPASTEQPWKQRSQALVRSRDGRRVLATSAISIALLVTTTLAIVWVDDGAEPLRLPSKHSQPAKAQPAKARQDIPQALRVALPDARARIAKHQCREAAIDLGNMMRVYPDVAELQYYLGAAEHCRRKYAEGIDAYRRALELQPRYRGDVRIIEDLATVLRRGSRDAAFKAVRLLARQGKAAQPALLGASSSRRRELRGAAIAALEALGAGGLIDRAATLKLDLAQTPDCDQRRAVIDKLVALENKAALAVLKSARQQRKRHLGFIPGAYRHACVFAELDAAIAKLEGKLR